jgi:hypothetical protein
MCTVLHVSIYFRVGIGFFPEQCTVIYNCFGKTFFAIIIKKKFVVKKAIIQFRLNVNTNALVNYRIISL